MCRMEGSRRGRDTVSLRISCVALGSGSSRHRKPGSCRWPSTLGMPPPRAAREDGLCAPCAPSVLRLVSPGNPPFSCQRNFNAVVGAESGCQRRASG